MALGAIQTVGPVHFDYQWFQTRYPELSEWMTPGQGQAYFDIASLYCDNTNAGGAAPFIPGWGCAGSRWGGAPVADIPRRQVLLGLLTAHVAALNAPLNGQASATSIGRLSSASEGSVSVSFAYPEVAGAEWYSLTKYGLQFWNATKQYRMGRYFPGPRSCGFYDFYRGRGF